MAINSLRYLFVVAIILCLYFLLQRTRLQRYVIFAADLYFLYAFSGKKGILVAFLILLTVYLSGRRIDALLAAKEKKKAFRILWVGGVIDIGILLYFKFLTDTWRFFEKNLHLGGIWAPVGLAYFCMSLLGYLFDVYHKKIKAEKSFIDLANFAFFFPAIIEGPFGFYRKLMPQLKEQHTFDWDRFVPGLQRILWGYFQKLVIADRIGILVMGILQDDQAAGLTVFLAMVFYSFQIYADFAGGIDVIMGISEIMGVSLFENFRSPLISRSVTEYWQRWHMSLGEWMEKYLYYPIVLNRKVMRLSKRIHHPYLSRAFGATLASVIVFIIVGIWHGTGWNYVVYGCYQAFWVSTAVLLKPVYQRMNQAAHIREDDWGWKVFQMLRTFVILVFGRYLIKASSLTQAGDLLNRTFAVWNPQVLLDGTLLQYGLNLREFHLMLACMILMFAVDVLHERGINFRQSLMCCNVVFRYCIYFLALFMILIMGVYGPGYDASSFIYAGF